MTSEGEARKTSEFLRRRKLRLQQVREQSKDIAKLIRQRAEVEKLKQVVELDAKKEKNFLQRQEKVVKKLEELYSKGLENVGTSHTDASKFTPPGLLVKTDLARLRGKEAAAELKRKKQEKLNEQKKSLDRKVQAREAANVISREKSTAVANKLFTKSSSSKFSDEMKSGVKSASADKSACINLVGQCEENRDLDREVARSDMATQWDAEILPNEWEPNIPVLAIPKDDSTKDTPSNDTEKQKRPNLFALSDEMPSSLRGIHHNDKESCKPSLTLVSEYIQNRALRLREPEVSKCNKKQSENLQSLKQTILRTRSSNPQAKLNNAERFVREDSSENGLTKKKSVTMYNHSTRDTRDVPFTDKQIVIRDMNSDKDAYSEALNENTSCEKDKPNKKIQDMVNKIAVTRQHVEKEYKDTMAFLSGLPKNKGPKPINKAYKDEHRLQMQRENRQRTLQQEFRKVEKESRHGMTCGAKSALPTGQPRKSPSAIGDSFNERDFQYSWMPVPEGDGNLAVHTIPTAVKEGKTGNSVKFSKVDSYHEYRSRHKHTPPTKDTSIHDKKVNKRYVEAVIIQQNDDNSFSGSSVTSNDGSIEDLRLDSKEIENMNNDNTLRELTDTERIIIYKILDYKNKKHDKTSTKFKTVEITQGSNDIENEKKRQSFHDTADKVKQQKENTGHTGAENQDALTSDDLDEGLYKIDGAKGDNITSMYYADGAQAGDRQVEVDLPVKQTSCKDNANNDNQFGEGQHCSREGCKNHQRLRRHCNKRDDNSTSKNQSSTFHPSVITSTTSFKTATNIKLDGAQAEGGYVKLVDEGGIEKGNIYIGATGLLRDDAYEVVIQLRKKGIIDSENKEVVIKNPKLDVQNDNKEKNTLTSVEPSVQMKPQDIENYSEAVGYPQTTATNQKLDTVTNNAAFADLAQNDICVKNPTGSKNDVSSSDKNKHDKETNPISNDVPKPSSSTTPIPRPATTACTQTAHGSPNPRPVIVHMSSSTSTAYMSPPEVIFPKFFRRSYESSDEGYQNFDRHGDRHVMYEQQPYCDVYSKCRCRRCVGHAKAYFKKIRTVEENILKTPPNTARSIDTEIGYDSFNIDNMKKRSTHSCPLSTYRYHKFKTKGNSKLCCKYLKKQPQVPHKRNIKTSVLYNRKGKISSNASKNTSKSYLNPLIKDYINKLLSLNREGIKAMQVMNQECSSVNTPADSILNIPSNIRNNKRNNNVLGSKISLEEIKNFIRKQIFEDYAIPHSFRKYVNSRDFKSSKLIPKHIKTLRRKSKKKNSHKVKNLNISKKIHTSTDHANFNESFAKRSNVEKNTMPVNSKSCRQSYASSKHENHRETVSNETGSKNILNPQNKQQTNKVLHARKSRDEYLCDDASCDQPKTVTSSGSTSPDTHIVSNFKRNDLRHPINSSTQTSRSIDNEINFMKLAEDKLQNMEKIANLTEKCTKRLSNLAKVLEEVRKNKSLAYSQISNSDSTDGEQKSEKPVGADKIEKQSSNSGFDVKEKTELKSPSTVSSKEGKELDSTDYEVLLFDIPKAGYIESPHSDSDNINYAASKTPPLSTTNIDCRINNTKYRSKPPPALLRIHLKRTQENVIPHELSTVIEVDSPMSVKLKNQSSNVDNANESKNLVESRKEEKLNINDSRNDQQINKVLRKSTVTTSNNNGAFKMISTDSSDDSKLRMMDLNQFNEIMLRPFISLREYAQEYYADDVVAKRENVSEDKVAIEDVSSLHSDGSLPDVVAELLKRKLITEPFKFDSASNVNSTTVSSESTLSVLALSRARKGKDKHKIIANKENLAETSDTLSISSNPDLENAFKKLGMGWASSTLKKTKERLALSSSSNTSSSSLSQFKFKNSSKQDMPTIVTDSVSSVPNLPMKTVPEGYTDISINAEQQTSLTNSMTVKEFLTKELAKKITFMNKSDRNETNEEFVSLLETKMPEELKNSCQTIIEDNSADNVLSENNRARTSTPVQIFKSVTYHSSSSSNISNGLFSNADDLSSVKLTSTSMRYHSTSEKDELTVPNYSLKMRKGLSDCSKTDSY